MRRTSTMRLVAAAIGTVALAASSAGAVSIAVNADCDFETLSEYTLTGGADTYTGVAYGYAVSDTPGASITVRCEVRVNGSPVYPSPTGSGTQFATASGQVTYTAADTDSVDLCAVWSGTDGSGEICAETTSTQVPPQAVLDVADLLLNQDVSFNNGDLGVVEQTVSETAEMLGIQMSGGPAKSGSSARSGKPTSHDLLTGCTYRYVRNAGVIQVVGKTKGGRHPVAVDVTIRCRLEDPATGTVLFDETRTEPGTIARLEGTVVALPDNVRVCNFGSGSWDDDDVVSSAWRCE